MTSLPLYDRDIPRALQDLSQLLPDVPTIEEPQQPEDPSTPPTEEPTSQADDSAAHDPAQVQVAHHQPEGPSNDPPVFIMPSGYTQTGCQICQPARFAYAAYRCKNMTQTGIKSVFDFHPFASLRVFTSTITQPDGYPNVMPLNVAMQQPNWDKFIDAMA